MTVELDRLALRHGVALLGPLAAVSDDEALQSLLDGVGWDFGGLGISASALTTDAAALQTALSAAAGAAGQLEIDLFDLAETLTSLGVASATFASRLSSLQTASGVPADALGKLREDVCAFLLERHTASRFPRAVLIASLLGVLKPRPMAQVIRADGQELRRQGTRLRLDTPGLAAALRDPLAYLRTTFLLDQHGVERAAQAVADLMGPGLADSLVAVGMTAGYGIVPVEPGLGLTTTEEAEAQHLLLVDSLVPGQSAILRVALGLTDDTNSQGTGVLLAASGQVSNSRTLANGTLTLTLKGAQQPLLITSKSIRLASGATTAATFDASLKYATSGSQSAARIGSPSGTRLQVGKVEVSIGVFVDGSRVDVAGTIDLKGLVLALRGGDGDGFLNSVLPKEPIEIGGDLGLDASLRQGVRVRGATTLDWRLSVGKTIGPIEVREARAALRAGADAATVELGAVLALQIGPLQASIEGLGLGLKLRSAASGGNLGPFELALGFKPPTGIGIGVDAGPVSGGGFISFDAEKGRYSGLLHLSIAGVISVTAIGLLDTKLPGGQPGYSFLIIVTAKFPPLQLGMGFTLSGLGGLAGIHRTIVIEALQAGIKTGSVDHILFPDDPVRDAPQIISDLSTIFPPVQGRYVFGPMAILGYGSGPATILEAELGILLELPAPVRVVILGQLHAYLPSPEAAAAELHLDVLGVIEFAKRTLAIDAVLHDSRLSTFPLTGDMALRLSWADPPAFAFAIGGFNPRFSPPPGFPELRRLTLTLSQGGNPLAVCQCYLALTSNTAQFGARAELSGSELGFTYSGWLGFDVLLVISPLSFVADLTAGVVVKKGSLKVASVTLEATLTGPTPWHLKGQASFDFIVHVTLPVELTVGEEQRAELPPTDPWPLLEKALEDGRNWRAVPGPAAFSVCALREATDSSEPLLDPLGGAAVHEKVVPLNRRLTRFGEVAPVGPDRYSVSTVKVGAKEHDHPETQDYFAPAQFEQLSDADKLSRPGFEKMDSGFSVASDELEIGAPLGTSLTLETIIVDEPDTPAGAPAPLTGKSYALSGERQLAALGGSAGARGGLAQAGEERFAPPPGTEPPAVLLDEEFLIVDVNTLAQPLPLPEPPSSRTKGDAEAALLAYLKDHPEQRGRLQVVPAQEAA